LVGLFFLSAAASWAQSAPYRVGVLTPGINFTPVFDGLREGLDRLGYKEGGNVTFIIEDTKGEVSGLGGRAKKLLEGGADVIFAVTTAYALAAKNASSPVPVVFAMVGGDPVGAGLVASFPSSQNNVTGVTSNVDQLSGKRLEILQEMKPGIKRVLVLVQPWEAITQRSFQLLEQAAKKLRVQLVRREVTSREEIERTLAQTPKGSVDAIQHLSSVLVTSNIELLIKKAIKDKLSMATQEASLVEKGALFSYGPDFRLVGAQAARLMAKVLKGEKPSDIPIETPEKFLLAVNLTVAKAIGLKIPRAVLERVDRVVE
jgi:putative ABC transport system substrate-binding protein